MVNITISEASGQFKQLYGDIQVPLASFIEEQEAKDRANCLALKIFSERTSTNFAEGYGGLTAAGEMQPVGEGGNPPANSFAQRELKIIENGVSTGYSEEEATKILSEKEVTAIADVKMGEASATAWGCDLTFDYVKINADYRS